MSDRRRNLLSSLKSSWKVAILGLLCALMLLLSSSALNMQTVSAKTTSTQCYTGSYTGITRDNKGDHHYVEFLVNVSMPDQYWYIQSRPWNFPFSSSLWQGYYGYHHGGGQQLYKELGFNWLWNWPSPYSASSWKICHN